MVSFAAPPPNRDVNPRHYLLPSGTKISRIYNRAFLQPDGYNHNGPRGRFDHHAVVRPPAHDPNRGVYYAASTLAGCIIEVFGDSGEIESDGYGYAEVDSDRDLILLDLNAGFAWEAGSVSALTQDGDRATSQAWARYFYEQHVRYGRIDGLRYQNAHNHAQAYVLFERAGAFNVIRDRALSDPALASRLYRIADRLRLSFSGP
jgi:hypothetical protein